MGPELFGVGFAEAVLVFVIALILVGPQRFPEIARQGGRWYRIARRYTAEITSEVRSAIDELEEEVKAEAAPLHEIRELGQQMDAELKQTEAELDTIGEEVAQAAASDTPRQRAGGTASPTPAAEATDPPPAAAEETATRPGGTEA